ncbi:hypothetical protein AB0O82_32705 [Kitasatospora sp. NPDC088264]|uniref:hypothetical protein n=1 Tax=Kitasatospora sp. NPDC088264 TaxID=3155296 RepID=UPI0034202D0B
MTTDTAPVTAITIPAPTNPGTTAPPPGQTPATTIGHLPGASPRTARIAVGELRELLADLPDHAPVLILVPGWDGTQELPLKWAHWDGALALETDYNYPDCYQLFDDEPEHPGETD